MYNMYVSARGAATAGIRYDINVKGGDPVVVVVSAVVAQDIR